MDVYESLTRQELVRKLLVQEKLCHELQEKVWKLQEEISRQVKSGEGFGENEGDSCEHVVVKRTERFLTDNVARLSLMLEAGNVFPWFADIVSGKIEIGDELFRAYGVDRKEFHDDFFRMTTFVASIYPDDRGIFEAIYNSLLAGESCKIGLQLRLDLLNTGVYKWVDLKGVAQEFDERGKVTKVLGFIANIQKRRDDEQALIEAKQRAEESDRLKSAFLANVSHEIRTPLNAIVGFSDLLGVEEDSELRQNYISLIKMNNDLLLSIVNDVLDISRIESDMMTFTYMDVYLPSFMKDLYNSIQLRKPEGVEITLDACPDIIFNIDRNRLWQICMNLLTNAVKHTKKGRIWFGYTIEAEEKMIKFYVSDTGCGIPKDELDNIFARFVQLSDFEQGVGLGLAICKGLVLKMGGNISVISEEGFGSTFIFTLPMKRPNSWKN